MRIIITCLIWYLVSSITSQLTKSILIEYKYPLFLSQFQFLIGSILSLSFILIARSSPKISGFFPLGSVPMDDTKPIFSKGAFFKILPLGLFQFCGKYCSLSATSLISLATVSSVKALSPLLIVSGYKLIYQVRFPIITYISLTPLVGGVILLISDESKSETVSESSNTDLSFDQIKGLIYCLISVLIFAAQNIYGKQLITWDSDTNPANLALYSNRTETIDDGFKGKFIRQRNNSIRLPYSNSDIRLDEKVEEKRENGSNGYVEQANSNKFPLFNPLSSFMDESDKIIKPDQMTIIFYCSIIGLIISSTGFMLNEFPHVLDIMFGRLEDSTPETKSGIIRVFYLILLNSVSHFIQTLLAFHLLGLIPAVSYSIASMMKRICLITVSIILATDYHDPNKYFGKITGRQIIGLLFTGIGLYCYDKWGAHIVKDKK